VTRDYRKTGVVYRRWLHLLSERFPLLAVSRRRQRRLCSCRLVSKSADFSSAA